MIKSLLTITVLCSIMLPIFAAEINFSVKDSTEKYTGESQCLINCPQAPHHYLSHNVPQIGYSEKVPFILGHLSDQKLKLVSNEDKKFFLELDEFSHSIKSKLCCDCLAERDYFVQVRNKAAFVDACKRNKISVAGESYSSYSFMEGFFFGGMACGACFEAAPLVIGLPAHIGSVASAVLFAAGGACVSSAFACLCCKHILEKYFDLYDLTIYRLAKTGQS